MKLFGESSYNQGKIINVGVCYVRGSNSGLLLLNDIVKHHYAQRDLLLSAIKEGDTKAVKRN
jgi:hypothetical protein